MDELNQAEKIFLTGNVIRSESSIQRLDRRVHGCLEISGEPLRSGRRRDKAGRRCAQNFPTGPAPAFRIFRIVAAPENRNGTPLTQMRRMKRERSLFIRRIGSSFLPDMAYESS
jgi:hypothetical protein